MVIENNIKFITDIDNVVNNWIGGFSPLEIKIIRKFMIPPILHLFSGSSKIGEIRIDIAPLSNATLKIDVFDYIQKEKPKINTIILDPIYCNENRDELWRSKYANGLTQDIHSKLYIFPYDTRKTRELWNFFKEIYPKRIIIKSLNHYTIPNYTLIQGYDIYPGAFKPNRCISIYQAKNKKLF